MNWVEEELVEDALRELADEAAQRRLWTASAGPEVSSFAECQCRLWDDSNLSTALEKDSVVYSTAIDTKLRALQEDMQKVDSDREVEAVLADPTLLRLRALASELLLELREFGHERT